MGYPKSPSPGKSPTPLLALAQNCGSSLVLHVLFSVPAIYHFLLTVKNVPTQFRSSFSVWRNDPSSYEHQEQSPLLGTHQCLSHCSCLSPLLKVTVKVSISFQRDMVSSLERDGQRQYNLLVALCFFMSLERSLEILKLYKPREEKD